MRSQDNVSVRSLSLAQNKVNVSSLPESPRSPIPRINSPYLSGNAAAASSSSISPSAPSSPVIKPSDSKVIVPRKSTRSTSKRSEDGKRTKPPASAIPAPPVPKILQCPEIPHDSAAPPAPPMCMYWSRVPVHGKLPTRSMRAHTVSLASDERSAWIFGGCDDRECASDVYVFDIETMAWSHPLTSGDIPPPCRAHTSTFVGNQLIVLGGGQGGVYYDTVYVLNTASRRWSRPTVLGSTTNSDNPVHPTPRRAHTAVNYKGRIWTFGGGNGINALSDVWSLEYREEGSSAPWRWHGPHQTLGPKPPARGYHTATLVKNVMVVVGGSDGSKCYDDVWTLNLDTLRWVRAPLTESYGRLSHTATLVGSYLFIYGGHDGANYVDGVLALNLVALQYESRKILGRWPSPRGYHATLLADRRLFLFGGYQGSTAFDDVWVLDLASNGYLPDVISFSVGGA